MSVLDGIKKCLDVHKGHLTFGEGTYVDHEGVQLLILPGMFILAGSNEAVDWYRNFDVFLAPGDSLGVGKVHRGFKRCAEKVWQHIKNSIVEEDAVTFYGHSQGGCVASLLALLYKNTYPNSRVTIVTYGSPAFVSSEFKKNFEGIMYTRFINSYDIVSSLPCIPIYKHPVEGIRLGLSGVLGRIRTLLSPIKTHWHISYIKELEKW